MANNQRPATSTQIRNMYSEGMSYMRTMFYNTSLSFALYPFLQKDANGLSKYDMTNGQQTTVGYEGAYALYQAARDILNGTVDELKLTVPCAFGAFVTLERRPANGNLMETIFSISKNNVIIPFKFQTIEQQTKVNGQMTTKIVESGLGAFMKTVEGYLTGINADRHLDKLTDDYVKSLNDGNSQNQNAGNNQGGYNNSYGNNNYNRGNYNGGKKNYGNNYRKSYNNNGGGGYNNYNNQNRGDVQPNQQNFSTYNPGN